MKTWFDSHVTTALSSTPHHGLLLREAAAAAAVDETQFDIHTLVVFFRRRGILVREAGGVDETEFDVHAAILLRVSATAVR